MTFTDVSGVPNPIRHLSDDESWHLLGAAQIARVAASRDGAPDIFPVSYLCHDHRLFFRTAAESRLRQECEGQLVAFEAASHEGGEAWSVVALGPMHTLDSNADSATLDALPILDFAPERPYVWMCVSPTNLRGRRFTIPPAHPGA